MTHKFTGKWLTDRVWQSGDLRQVYVGGIPMIFTEIDELDRQEGNLRFQVSDMLKAVGMLDYLLPREWKDLLEKRQSK